MAFDLELAPETPNQPPMAHFEPDALSQGEKESEWWPTEPSAWPQANLWPGQAQQRGQHGDGPVCGLLGSGTAHITARLNGALPAVGRDPSVMTHLA